MNKYDYLVNNFVSPYNFIENNVDDFLSDNNSNILSNKQLDKLLFKANIYSNKKNLKKVKKFSKKNYKKKESTNNTKKYKNKLSKKNIKIAQKKHNITNKKINLK